jgi:hypothetical protein
MTFAMVFFCEVLNLTIVEYYTPVLSNGAAIQTRNAALRNREI